MNAYVEYVYYFYLDTFISSITTDLKMLICSYEHLVVGNVVLL